MINKRHIFGANIINTMTIMKNLVKIMPVCIMAMLACSCDNDSNGNKEDESSYFVRHEGRILEYNMDMEVCNGQTPLDLDWTRQQITKDLNEGGGLFFYAGYAVFKDMGMFRFVYINSTGPHIHDAPYDNLFDCNGQKIDPAIFTQEELNEICDGKIDWQFAFGFASEARAEGHIIHDK